MLRTVLQHIVERKRWNKRYRTLNHISLRRSSVIHNLSLVRNQHHGFGIIPVLKSNAYGHGLKEMAEILNSADCDFLAVDGYFEAAKIRHLTRHRILLLGYILPENTRVLDTRRCAFVVQDIAGLEAFGKLHRPVKIHMEINTGMNRLGLRPNEIEPYLATFRRYPSLELEGVMTHLADADNDSDDTWTNDQTAIFDACVKRIFDQGYRPKYIHIAQTAGSLKVQSSFANTIRLGIGLYGINPLSPHDGHYRDLQSLQPTLELKSTIIKVIELEPNERVGYSGIFTATQKTRIGILALGYYEGVPRELSNKGTLTMDNWQLPIVGRVCMNHTMVDLSDTDLQKGDEVVVISSDTTKPNSIAQISADHGLFSYAIATNISSSIRRKII